MAASLASNTGGRLNAYAATAASSTDAVLITAVAGKKLRVHAWVINHGDTTPSTVTFNSKGSGAGTAISPAWKAPANSGFVCPETPGGWFETNRGEALTVTTGSGSTTNIQVQYSYVH